MVHPYPANRLLLAYRHRALRPLHDNDNVAIDGACAGCARFDRTEKQDLRAGEIGADGDLGLGEIGYKLVRARRRCSSACQKKQGRKKLGKSDKPPHFTTCTSVME